MDGQQFKIIIAELGFASLRDFSAWIEINDRTAARWVADGPPTSVAMLLSLMLKVEYAPIDVGRVLRAKMNEVNK